MKWWKVLIALLLLGLSGVITALGLRDRPPPAVEVAATAARRATIVRTVTGAGKVQAATTVKISSNISGDLTELRVKEAERVQRGQVLGLIDRRRYEAALKQTAAARSAARAEVQLAQVEVDRALAEQERVAGLTGKGMAAQAELERARSDHQAALARRDSARQRLAQAGAALEEAENTLEKTTLVSPIDGTVIELDREVGERVRGSDFSEDVVMIVAALFAMEVRIEVGEHEVVHLETGQAAEVSIDALEGQSFPGTVVQIAQKGLVKNPGTEAEVTSFPVTVSLASRPPGVLPGMSAEVRILAQTHEQTIVVPIQAVTVRSAKTLPPAPEAAAKKESEALTSGLLIKENALAKVVFVIDAEGRARVRRVQTGISSESEIEVLSGLAEGEKLVEGPYRTLSKELKEGDRVKVSTPGPGEQPGSAAVPAAGVSAAEAPGSGSAQPAVSAQGSTSSATTGQGEGSATPAPEKPAEARR